MKQIPCIVMVSAILMLLLAGCTSSGSYQLGDETTSLKSSYESVKIIVNPKAEGASDSLADIRSALAGQLISSGQFHKIVDKD